MVITVEMRNGSPNIMKHAFPLYLVASVLIGYSRTEMTLITEYIHKNMQRVTFTYVIAFNLSRFLSYIHEVGHKITWTSTFRNVHLTRLLPYKSETDHEIFPKTPLHIYLVASCYVVFFRMKTTSVANVLEKHIKAPLHIYLVASFYVVFSHESDIGR